MGADRHARARRSRSRSPAAADARRRPHRPHAGAHLPARRPPRRRRSRSNQLAAKADEDYIAQCRAQGLYPLGYYPHNLHFIWMGATASGQRHARARVGAASWPARFRTRRSTHVPILQGFLVVPYWAMVRFERVGRRSSRTRGRATTRRSRAASGATRARWRSSRKDQLDEAEQELAQLRDARRGPVAQGPDDVLDQHRRGDPAHRAGSGRRRDRREAARTGTRRSLHLDRAVRYEDALDLPGAARLARAGAAEPRRGAARGRPRRRGRGGLLGGPEEEPGERLVARSA